MLKGGAEYRVPLAPAAVELLRALPRLDDGTNLFPGARAGKPLLNRALLMLLRRMGREVTAHGMRSAFRDWAAEVEHAPREVAEAGAGAQLRVEGRGRLPARRPPPRRRRQLVEAWATYING
jgi:integrase